MLNIESNKARFYFTEDAVFHSLLEILRIDEDEINKIALKNDLFIESRTQLKAAAYPLIRLCRDRPDFKVFETPSAIAIETLFSRKINNFISKKDVVPLLYLQLYDDASNAAHHLSPSQISKKHKEANTHLETLRDDMMALKRVYKIIHDESKPYNSDLQTILSRKIEFCKLYIEREELNISIANRENNDTGKKLRALGKSDHSKKADWRWMYIGAFASIMYRWYIHLNPDLSVRGKFGVGGTVQTYNSFLLDVAKEFFKDAEKKTRLERIWPRPEHINVIEGRLPSFTFTKAVP